MPEAGVVEYGDFGAIEKEPAPLITGPAFFYLLEHAAPTEPPDTHFNDSVRMEPHLWTRFGTPSQAPNPIKARK